MIRDTAMSRFIPLLILMVFFSNRSHGAGSRKKREPDRFLPVISRAEKKKGNRMLARALNNRARYSYKLKRYGEAMEIWHEAVLVDPLWWEPYYNMGWARILEGRMKDAAEYFGLALKVDRSEMVSRLIMKDEKLKDFRNTGAYAGLLHMLKHRFYIEPERISTLEDIRYPIGWSKKGSFAYISRRYNGNCSCNGYEFIIRWWKTGEVVSSMFWKSEPDDGLHTLWKKNYQAISAQLNRYKIVQFTSFQPVSDSVTIDDRRYTIGIDYRHETAFIRYRCQQVKGKVIDPGSVKVYFSSKDGEKIVRSDTIKGYINDIAGLISLRIRKILFSPFGNNAAVIMEYRSYDDSCNGKSGSNNRNPYVPLNIIRLL